MAYHSADFDNALAVAAGDDAMLEAELRLAFAASLARQIDLLGRARCDANWYQTAERIHSLAASFHVVELIELAEQANKAAPGDPQILRHLSAFSRNFSGMQ